MHGILAACSVTFDPLREDPGIVVFLNPPGTYPTSGFLNNALAPAANGEGIRQWTDDSGHGNHAVQATVGQQPPYDTTLFDGNPALSSGAANQYVVIPTQSTIRSICVEYYKTIGGARNFTTIIGSGTTFDFAGNTDASNLLLDPVNAAAVVLNGTAYQSNQVISPTLLARPDTPGWSILVTTGNAHANRIDQDRIAGREWPGPIRRVIISTTAWSAQYIASLCGWLTRQTPYRRELVAIGNSITLGVGATVPSTQSYPAQLVGLLGGAGAWRLDNLGVASETTQTEITKIGLYARYAFGPSPIALVSEVTNSMYFDVLGGTIQPASTYVGYLRTLLQGLQAYGLSCMTTTVLPRSNAPMTGPQITAFETLRGQVNPLIRTDPVTSMRLADWAASPVMGQAGDETNGTYYSGDNVHPNTNGYSVLASICQPIVAVM